MSTGFNTVSPNTSYSYAIQGAGANPVDGADAWNPDEFTSGDQHYGSITGRDVYSQFGRGLDTDFEGERLVGGGPTYDNGRGYIQVYDWSESVGSWTSISQIDGPVAGGWFGESISMDYDGKRIIVGAPKAGNVYIYDYGVSGFTLSQTIATSIPSFGHCVSIAGDRADRFVVGAPSVNTIYVYELQSTGLFLQVYSNVGTNIINDIPVNSSGSNRITLYPEFNGYGYSVKMSGFGEHIVVGAPGTELIEIQSSVHGGTTTAGPVSHHLGEHMLSSTGPHYSGTTSYSCNFQQGQLPSNATGTNISASHPYSAYQVGTYTPTRGNNGTGLRYADSNGQYHQPNRSPYGVNSNIPSANLVDGFIHPNFQIGHIRILKCTPNGSWGGSVTQIGSDIKGTNVDSRNNLSSWDSSLKTFPGFGKTVAISADGARVSVGSPGYSAVGPALSVSSFGYDVQAAHGDTRYFIYNTGSDTYDEPMTARDADNTPSLGGPWTLLRKPSTWTSWNLSMSEDGSRVFIGSRESDYAILAYDFSGTTFYPASPIIRSGGQGGGPDDSIAFGSTAPNQSILAGKGYLSGYRNVAHNGAICAVSHPAYPEAFGATFYGGSNTIPAGSNNEGRGTVVVYRFTLTGVIRGNSLFEGYVKCDNLTIGSSGGSVDHARIKFGGRKGESGTEAATTVESRWLGTHDAVYAGTATGTAYKHDNELLLSKFYSDRTLPNDTVKDYYDWNKRDFAGDRIRLKAPKVEIQIHHPQADQGSMKYKESPCLSITDMNNPFGGERGASYSNGGIRIEPRQLMSFRTGTSNSRMQAGASSNCR